MVCSRKELQVAKKERGLILFVCVNVKSYVFVANYVVAIYDSGNNVMETLQMTQNWSGSVIRCS